MTPAERLEALVSLACEAWERSSGHAIAADRDERRVAECLEGFRVQVRERLAQGVQAWTLEASAEADDARHAGRVFGLSEAALLARSKAHEARHAATGRELTGIGIRLLATAETLDTWADRCAERAKRRL